jgi:AAA domain
VGWIATQPFWLHGKDGAEDYNQARRVWNANLPTVRTQQVKAAFGIIDQVMASNHRDGDKLRGSAVIDALPGLGKTTTAAQYAKEFHRTQYRRYGPATPEGHQRLPVMFLSLSAGVTLKGLNLKMLEFYGHPAASRASRTQLGSLAVDCVLSCATRVIVIDDLHFIDFTHRNGLEVSNHLKWLAKSAAAPVYAPGFICWRSWKAISSSLAHAQGCSLTTPAHSTAAPRATSGRSPVSSSACVTWPSPRAMNRRRVRDPPVRSRTVLPNMALQQPNPSSSSSSRRRGLRDIVGGYSIDRWPITINVADDETLVSWFRRVSDRYQLTPRQLCEAMGIKLGNNPKPDPAGRALAAMCLLNLGRGVRWSYIALELGLPARLRHVLAPKLVNTPKPAWRRFLSSLEDAVHDMCRSPPHVDYRRRRIAAADPQLLRRCVAEQTSREPHDVPQDWLTALWAAYTGGAIGFAPPVIGSTPPKGMVSQTEFSSAAAEITTGPLYARICQDLDAAVAAHIPHDLRPP